MTNLATARDEIKAILAGAGDTPTAKLIAILDAAGICNTAEVAALVGLKVRAIQTARRRNGATQCAGATECAQQNAQAQPIAPENATYCAEAQPIAPRARVEGNNNPSYLEDRLVLKTPLPPKKPNLHGQALEAFEAYNATALRCGLPQAAKLTPDRKSKIIARLKDYGMDGWAKALANIDRSKFLCGDNDRGWRANLDFLLQPSSFAKVHDGGYGNGRHAEPKRAVVYDPAALQMRDELIALGWEPNQ